MGAVRRHQSPYVRKTRPAVSRAGGPDRVAVGEDAFVTRRMRKKVQRRLMHSVMFGDTRQVARALRCGADPNLIDRFHGTPIYQASVGGRSDVVRMLARAGADPNAETSG